MGHSNEVSARDALRLMRVVGEISELARDPGERRRHLIERLCHVVGAQVGIFGDCVNFRADAVPGFVRSTEGGWLGAAERRAYLAYLADGAATDPAVWPLIQKKGGVVTCVRRELVNDQDWYGSRHVGEYRRAAHVDDCIYSMCRTDAKGTVQLIGLHRPWGDANPFTERDRLLVQLVHRAVSKQLRSPPSHTEPDPRMVPLPPRLKQVLDRLLSGDGEKQAAKKLSLSPHTINDYVKELYRRFHVNTRSELMALFVRR